jgi:hypothetical protein
MDVSALATVAMIVRVVMLMSAIISLRDVVHIDGGTPGRRRVYRQRGGIDGLKCGRCHLCART